MNSNVYQFDCGHSSCQSRYYPSISDHYSASLVAPTTYSTLASPPIDYLSPPATPPTHLSPQLSLQLTHTMDMNRGYSYQHPHPHPEPYRLPAMTYSNTQPPGNLPSPRPLLNTTIPQQMGFSPANHMHLPVTTSNVISTYYPTDPMSNHGQYMPTSMHPMNTGVYYYSVPNAFATGKQKKEIKRRTKSGCMTCRQRRIKVSKQSASFHTVHYLLEIVRRKETQLW